MIISSFILLLQMALSHCFYGQTVFHYVYIPHLLCPLIYGHLGFLHVLANVTSAAIIRVCISFHKGVYYSFVQMCALELDCWIIWQLYF